MKSLLVQGMLFEEMGFTYLGPIDGHDFSALEQHLNYCKNVKGPVLLHVLTRKGEGYSFAEAEPDKFHGIAPFDPKTGKVLNKSSIPGFSSVFGKKLTELAAYNSDIVAITAAMPDGTGLRTFSQRYPDRFFDVGIAEPHAVTYAAALAKNDLRPCVAIYSSFLQRAVDQIYHDVCLQKLPVVFGIDRAGVVGEDGETHQGLYDIAMLRSLPHLVLLAPGTQQETEEMLSFAFSQNMPCGLRYARGSVSRWDVEYPHTPIALGKGELVREGKDVLLIPLGIMMEEGLKAAALLEQKGIKAGVFNPRFIKPLDEDQIASLAKQYPAIVTIEDHVIGGGFGAAVSEALARKECYLPIKHLGYPDEPIRQGKRADIMKKYHLDAAGIAASVWELIGK